MPAFQNFQKRNSNLGGVKLPRKMLKNEQPVAHLQKTLNNPSGASLQFNKRVESGSRALPKIASNLPKERQLSTSSTRPAV
jgi:hypothetical protein